MEEKNNVAEVAENSAPAETEKSSTGSFKCIAAPHDKRIFVIALLTAIITVVLYHFVMTAVEYFCKDDEDKFVSCYCHTTSSEDDDEDGEKAKKFQRRHKKMDGKRGEFFRRMPPEMREKIKNMSPEERKEFFAKLRQKRGGKDAPGRPEGRHPRRRPEAAPQE